MKQDSQKDTIKDQVKDSKIVFVMSGPQAGKTKFCAKMVEDFGFTHICTGELLRAECEKGTKEGERLKKLMCDGAIIPTEQVVPLLKSAMMQHPSKNYVIDGFPRSVDQGQMFEQQVAEMQTIIHLEISQEQMSDRLSEVCVTSERLDHTQDIIKKKLNQYQDQTVPMYEYYTQFGKVRTVPITYDFAVDCHSIHQALLPEVTFIIGSKCSGKTSLASHIANRTNMMHVQFENWLKNSGNKQKDDETQVLEMIRSQLKPTASRVIIEGFPKNEFQAKVYARNCKAPINVFVLECPKDVCQERMDESGESDKNYLCSGILAQRIKEYNNCAKDLVPFLKANCNTAVLNTNQPMQKTLDDVYKCIEPNVIHIRPGANSNDLRKEITEGLCKEHKFYNLDINQLIREENERKTVIGQEINTLVSANKIIPAELIVRMLRKIIYSGDRNQMNFILTSFPDIIEQARELETSCVKLSAVLYCHGEGNFIEIKNNNLSLFNIDSFFQKEFRLRSICTWDWPTFQQKLGNTIEFGVAVGDWFTGKTTLCNVLRDEFGFNVINMQSFSDKIKATLGTEEEPFEGKVPIADIEKAVCAFIQDTCAASTTRCKFIFDGFLQATPKEFMDFAMQFGNPTFMLSTSADEKTIKQRWMKKNETEEITEEQAPEFGTRAIADSECRSELKTTLKTLTTKVNFIELESNCSIESTCKTLKSQFTPRVLLVNHEKRLGIDTTCSNLAIKWNMIYISAYQLIKQHITQQTEWGHKLLAVQRTKEINLTTQVRDEFNELEYSPVHFDTELVVQLIKATVNEKKTSQQVVLLEGMCNSTKLGKEDDQLEVRLMDELQLIERHIGPISGAIGLQFNEVAEKVKDDDIKWEDFNTDKQEGQQPQPAEGAAPDEEAPAEGEEAKKTGWKPEDFKWTKTNRNQKTLPQLYLDMKGKICNHEVKPADHFSSSQYEAISKSLDEFCKRVTEFADEPAYQQVIFSE